MESEILMAACFVVVLLMAALGGGILAIVALTKIGSLRKEVDYLRGQVFQLQRQSSAPVSPPVAAQTPAPAAPPAPARTAPPVAQGVPPISRPVVPPQMPPARPSTQMSMRQLESKIGQRWIAWVGAVVVFFSAVFFLKYAFDNDWIGPTGQVVICAFGAGIMAAIGNYFIAKKWRMLGQSLMGLGLSILYATFYAACQLYSTPVMSHTTAFVFMVLVTTIGMYLAVMHSALTIAFLAVLGGLLTPVLVSTGRDSHDVLFSYLVVLNLGVMAVAFFRRWRMLDTLAMAGTFIMYAGWFDRFYQPPMPAIARPEIPGSPLSSMELPPPQMAAALAWLAVFYVMYLVLPFVYHLVRKTPVTIERFIMAIVNAAFCGGYAWTILHTDHPYAMGFVSLGMAGAYVTMGALLRRRLPEDATSLFGAVAMAVTFLTLAVPMELQAHGILLAWVCEAPVLALLGYRFRYLPVRIFAAAVLVLGIGRLFIYHWPLHDMAYVPYTNRYFLSAICVPAAMAALALAHQMYRKQATLADRVMQVAAALGAGLLALVVLHSETAVWLERDYTRYAATCAVACLWAVGSLVYLASGDKVRPSAIWTWAVGTFVLLISSLWTAIAYDQSVEPGIWLFANWRFAVGVLMAATYFAYSWTVYRSAASLPGTTTDVARPAGIVYLVLGLSVLLIVLSVEVLTFCRANIEEYTRAQRAGQMSVTLVWSLYAAGLLVIGFWRRMRSLRLAGLALFGLAALKLVVLDLGFLRDVYRIVSFLVLGLLMLAASYLYHRLEKRLSAATSAADEPETPSGVTV